MRWSSSICAECGKSAARGRPAHQLAGQRRAIPDDLSGRLGCARAGRWAQYTHRAPARRGTRRAFPGNRASAVREKASVIVASGDAAVHAAQQATYTIPIIGIVDDIVGAGLIKSLAKPGGNTTGVSIIASELDASRLEIVKERDRALGPTFRRASRSGQYVSTTGAAH
jgi:hypothetical protein